jgi:hypothetical protein
MPAERYIIQEFTYGTERVRIFIDPDTRQAVGSWPKDSTLRQRLESQYPDFEINPDGKLRYFDANGNLHTIPNATFRETVQGAPVTSTSVNNTPANSSSSGPNLPNMPNIPGSSRPGTSTNSGESTNYTTSSSTVAPYDPAYDRYDPTGVRGSTAAVSNRLANGGNGSTPGNGTSTAAGSSNLDFYNSSLSQRERELAEHTRARDIFMDRSSRATTAEEREYNANQANIEDGLVNDAQTDIDSLRANRPREDQHLPDGTSRSAEGGKPGVWQRLQANKMKTMMVGISGLALGAVAYQMGANGLNFGSAIGMLTSFSMFTTSLKDLGFTGGQAMLGGGLIVGAGFMIGMIKKWVREHGKKQDQDLDLTQGDVAAYPNTPTPPAPTNTTGTNTASASNTTGSRPQTWYEYLPSQNVFMILAGVSALTFGGYSLNLNGTGIQNDAGFTVNSTALPGFTQTMEAASGKKLPNGLGGKIFIKKGDGNSNPDKVVYFTQEKGDTETNGVPDMVTRVNMVSINPGGYVLGPSPIDMLPFFSVEPQTRAIVANSNAAAVLGRQTALAQAATSGVSAASAATAARRGSLSGHYVDVIQN